jgi:hypothetical protein
MGYLRPSPAKRAGLSNVISQSSFAPQEHLNIGPPRELIALTVQLLMMVTAERNGETSLTLLGERYQLCGQSESSIGRSGSVTIFLTQHVVFAFNFSGATSDQRRFPLLGTRNSRELKIFGLGKCDAGRGVNYSATSPVWLKSSPAIKGLSNVISQSSLATSVGTICTLAHHAVSLP